MNVEYVKAESSDFEILGQMNKSLIQDEGHSNPMTVDELTERMAKFLTSEYSAYLICVDDDISGYCLFRDDKDHIYVRQLFVKEDKRRIGLGRSCVNWLKENVWVGRNVAMEVLCSNKMGIEFWRSVGFKDYCISMVME